MTSRKKAHKIDFRWRYGRVRMSGYTSKRSTEELEDKLRALAAYRELDQKPDAELMRWLDAQPERMLERLAKHKLIDPERASMAKELLDHLRDYEESMKSRKRNSRHIKQEISRIEKMIAGCKLKKHCDISADKVIRWVSKEMEDKTVRKKNKSKAKDAPATIEVQVNGIGPRTANSYLTAFCTFLNWMVPERASHNPLEHVNRFNEKVDVRRERRALSADELRRLLSAAESGDAWRSMPGPERAMLYRVAMETGLRWSELRSLTRSSFDLVDTSPSVTVAAAYTKNSKDCRLPIRPELRRDLAAKFAESLALPTAPVFPNMPKGTVGAKMIRHDLTNTGDLKNEVEPIPYRDAQGRVADFHALRHSFVSSLAQSGVHPSVAQSLARHSTITLTMDRYTHTALESQQEAIQQLPDLSLPELAVVAKTGTDDAENKWPNIDQNLPKSTDRRPNDLDTSGLSDLPKAAGAESLNLSDTNEKALQTQSLQGLKTWGEKPESNRRPSEPQSDALAD